MAKIIKGADVGPRNDRSLGGDLLKIVGVGLAAGIGLIAGTNAVMKKAAKKHAKGSVVLENEEDFPEDEDDGVDTDILNDEDFEI